MTHMTDHKGSLAAAGRKVTDGRGNIQRYEPHACDHYETIPLSDADEYIRTLVGLAAGVHGVEMPEDSPALREAIRTFVGYGVSEDGRPYAAICHDSHCYPKAWPDDLIRSCEVFVHGVVTDSNGITATTVPGPRAYCQKICYKQTPHFFDVEVWDETELWGPASGKTGRKYQIVLRCEVCHHGYNLVTKSTPSRWRRLMKDPTARTLLAGAEPNRV
jgi:hypothetical protein